MIDQCSVCPVWRRFNSPHLPSAIENRQVVSHPSLHGVQNHSAVPSVAHGSVMERAKRRCVWACACGSVIKHARVRVCGGGVVRVFMRGSTNVHSRSITAVSNSNSTQNYSSLASIHLYGQLSIAAYREQLVTMCFELHRCSLHKG